MATKQRRSYRITNNRDQFAEYSRPKPHNDRSSLDSASLILFHLNQLSDDDEMKYKAAGAARTDKLMEKLSKTIKHSDALVARYGVDGFAVLLRRTDFSNAVQVVGSIARRLASLGFAFSSTHPLVIQVGPASSLLLKMSTSLGSIAPGIQPLTHDYVRSPEFECL
jgi:GGDEF domain-containing protein